MSIVSKEKPIEALRTSPLSLPLNSSGLNRNETSSNELLNASSPPPHNSLSNTSSPITSPRTLSFTTMTSGNFVWPCTSSLYKLGNIIDSNEFSVVYSAECRRKSKKSSKNERVAIKITNFDKISSNFETIINEIQSMKLCSHDNLLNFYCNFINDNHLWSVSQLLNMGSCMRILDISFKLYSHEGLPEDVIAFILSEILKALNYLHSQSYSHGDIKANNILISNDGQVKLSDFACSFGSSLSATHIAPEICQSVVNQNSFSTGTIARDFKSDIWSLGITALELAKGSPPLMKFFDNLSKSSISIANVCTLISFQDSDYLFDLINSNSNIFNDVPKNIIEASGLSDFLNKKDKEKEKFDTSMIPSLFWRYYSHDRQCHADGQSFSRNFEDFYKKCLQKNPRLRQSISELVHHRLFRFVKKESLINYLKSFPTVTERMSNSNDENSSVNNDHSNLDYDKEEEIRYRRTSRSESLEFYITPPLINMADVSHSKESFSHNYNSANAITALAPSQNSFPVDSSWIFDFDQNLQLHTS